MVRYRHSVCCKAQNFFGTSKKALSNRVRGGFLKGIRKMWALRLIYAHRWRLQTTNECTCKGSQISDNSTLRFRYFCVINDFATLQQCICIVEVQTFNGFQVEPYNAVNDWNNARLEHIIIAYATHTTTA